MSESKREGECRKTSRRDALKTIAGTAVASLIPPYFSPQSTHQSQSAAALAVPAAPARNPGWYGFNLLEYFSTDPDWMKYFPYKDDGMFSEDDFRWISDWGFNWVRLPMDYRFWTDPDDLLTIDVKKVEPIDRAVRLGEKYGVHVNISLHRAPGFCILDTLDEKNTGIHITREKLDLFTSGKALDAFVSQWAFFAERYKGVSNDRVSFNLVNEPLLPPSPAEAAARKSGHESFASRDLWLPDEKKYARVASAAINSIRAHDPNRLIVTDGYLAGNLPVPDLYGTGILQSAHDYNPALLTHYQCEWARGFVPLDTPLPTWPLKNAAGKIIADRSTITTAYAPWNVLPAQGIPIHFGEMGCYKHTPPGVVYAWFNDSLDMIGSLCSGWALWNFRGPFGVLDTERQGTKFEDWHGHQLDRTLLQLLQSKMKRS